MILKLLCLNMVCNQQKTEVVIFGNHGISGENKPILVSNQLKALGLWSDKDLKCDFHVDHLIKKCRSLGFGLRYLKRFLSQSEMRTIFQTHFISKLTHGCSIWYNAISFDLRAKIR